jgi:hypothetical protein
VQLGDENTSLFHSIATISHRKNFITALSTGEVSLTDHDQKAQLLWDNFKLRMCITEFKGISYDLSTLLTTFPMDHLELDRDFS